MERDREWTQAHEENVAFESPQYMERTPDEVFDRVEMESTVAITAEVIQVMQKGAEQVIALSARLQRLRQHEALRRDPEVEIVTRAFQVLGPAQTPGWLKMAVPSLNGRTPLSLITTAEGRAQVERVLVQIEHGVF